MADEIERVRHWARVPNDSVLEISVTGTTQTTSVSASVDWLDTANGQGTPSLNTVSGAPFRLPLRSPLAYSVDVLLTFLTQATATVVARIVKPDQETHGTPHEATITADSNANEFFSYFILTRRE